MDERAKNELKTACPDILFDEPLSRHTSIRVGGPVDALASPAGPEELISILRLAREKGLPIFILGAGSNVLVRDMGIRGLAVRLGKGFAELKVEDEGRDSVLLRAGAGVGIPRLVEFTADEGLTGLEGVTGVPGNVGGAVVMNAGTPDGEIGDVVECVTCVDREGRTRIVSKEEARFGYRESHFPKGAVVISASFRLRRLSSEKVKGTIQKYRSRRIETQPLNVPNIGSVFKNDREKRLFAGKMIEEAGLKNIRVGGARISPKHGNFIVNEGGATAKDVLALIGLVKDKVKEKFGVSLQVEARIVGEEE